MKGIRQAVTLLAAVSVMAVALTAAASALVSTDGSESATGVAKEYAVVQLLHDPIASYEGGLPGLPATKPAPGEKLDLTTEAAQKYSDFLASERGEYLDWLSRHAPQVEILREYEVVLNGLAVKLNEASLSLLSSGPGAKVAVHSWLYRPAMNVSPDIIQARAAWEALQAKPLEGDFGPVTQKKVGVIDTGIDHHAPFIVAEGCREADDISEQVFFSGEGTFDPDRTIVFSHGTHVAGTIGGCPVDGPVPGSDGTTLPVTGTLSGIAPGVELHDYNVFPGYGAGFIAFGGSAFSHDIIEAIEQAVEDGMDVINMSLGGGVDGPHDLLAEATTAAADAGVVPAVAAGNSGPGDMTVLSPGNAEGALTAGATTNPHFVGIPVEHPDLGTFGAALGDFLNFIPPEDDPGLYTDVTYRTTTPANGCEEIEEDLTGEIALIDRGACFFTTKILNAQEKGAIGVLIVNNVAGDPVAMGHASGLEFPEIPAAMVSKDNGNAMKETDTMTVTVDGTTLIEFRNPENADIIAGFSSRGPTPFDHRIKPDFTAPGVNVLSSILEDEFAFFQGTSMATPHVAGAAALLLALHDDWSPQDVKSALANTADRVVTDHVDAADDPGVLARGGGRINLANALDPPVTLDPVSVSFGVWTGNKAVEASVDVLFRSQQEDATVTCSLSVDGEIAGSLAFSSNPVEVLPGETASVTVTLSGGMSLESGDYEGDIVATCSEDDADPVNLRAPYWTRVNRRSGDLQGFWVDGGGFETLSTVARTWQQAVFLTSATISLVLAAMVLRRRRR